MTLQLNERTARQAGERRPLWNDTLAWWVNCLAIERFWFYAGTDLQVARGRRDAMLSALIDA